MSINNINKTHKKESSITVTLRFTSSPLKVSSYSCWRTIHSYSPVIETSMPSVVAIIICPLFVLLLLRDLIL